MCVCGVGGGVCACAEFRSTCINTSCILLFRYAHMVEAYVPGIAVVLFNLFILIWIYMHKL